MKKIVNGDEVELQEEGCEILPLDDRVMVRTNGSSHTAVGIRIGNVTWVSFQGRQFKIEDPRTAHRHGSHIASGELRAPMPGLIVSVKKEPGTFVKKGDAILVLEAMKTQQPFLAPFDGVLTEVRVRTGDQVLDGEIVAVVEEAQ